MTEEQKTEHKLIYIGPTEDAYRLKTKAAELEFPSLASFLRAISLTPTRKLKDLLKK